MDLLKTIINIYHAEEEKSIKRDQARIKVEE